MNGQSNQISLEGIKKLSVAERILIIEDIWDSIYSSEEDLPLTDEQKSELDSRLESYKHSPEAGKAWKDVKDNIKSHL